MDWECSQCTYINESNKNICTMCEEGYRIFSRPHPRDDSMLSAETNEFREDEQLLPSNLIDSDPACKQNNSNRRHDLYVRKDGELLYDQDAVDERRRAIAKRKAQDLKRLLEQSSKKRSTIKINSCKASGIALSKVGLSSASKGHVNALTAHARGANLSATATAQLASASALNASATGANASTSCSASAVRMNAMNANATGVSTSTSATADGLNVSIGNASATGLEVAASASASVAQVAAGNVDVNGGSIGASAKINGTGVKAGNVAIGGASAAMSASIDGSLSFGNINIGLRPSFDVGMGFNIGIPFLSGSQIGAGGNGGEGQQNSSGVEGNQKSLSEKYPNRRIYAQPVDVSIKPNRNGEPIDPLLPASLERKNDENPVVDKVIDRHNELIKEQNRFVGFKGGPKWNSDSAQATNTETSTNTNLEPSAEPASSEPDLWAGMYGSPSPSVAGGYAIDERGRPGEITRLYLPEKSAHIYYTKTGLETSQAKEGVKAVQEHSNNRYIFSGPQSSKDKDLFDPELVISPAVRDEALANRQLKFEPSGHQIDSNSCRLREVHEKELQCSTIVPDYLVNIKTADDCARDGGRERLAHVFQGQPPYGHETSPRNPRSLTVEDQLLLEECRNLGFEPPIDQLEDWKKQLKSDAEYQREQEEEEKRANQVKQQGILTGSTTTDDQEMDETSPEPCKSHANNIRCMKCLKGSSGPKIRKIHEHIHGF